MSTKRLPTAAVFLAALPLLLAATLIMALSPQTAHKGPELEQGKDTDLSPPRTKSCTKRCHRDLVAHRVLHAPLAKDPAQACSSCHELAKDELHLFSPVLVDGPICARCHTLELEEHVHQPIAKGRCSGCHDPHGASNQKLLRADTEHELCLRCHPQPRPDGVPHVHSPVATGKCSLCHAPHSSPFPGLLQEEGPDSCLECHDEVADAIDKAEHVHAPLEADCGACHDPHGSAHPAQLLDQVDRLCLKCHESIRAEVKGAKFGHGALQVPGSCTACHRPHTSQKPKLLDDRPSESCAKCHAKPIERDGSVVTTAVSQLVKTRKHLHGPLQKGDCVACHAVHGSENHSLLKRVFPARLYASYSAEGYALCFGCHEEKVFTTEKTAELTGFRDGERNLHFLHVNKQAKGRTCRSCHEVHASDQPHLIAETVVFGKWTMPMNYEPQPKGGRCAPGCHAPFSYERERPIRGSAPAEPPGR